jgi:hypothetical protein
LWPSEFGHGQLDFVFLLLCAASIETTDRVPGHVESYI